MYAITASVLDYTQSVNGECRQIPTFYLDETVQGILNENQARHIAVQILNPFSREDVIVFADAAKVEPNCDKQHYAPEYTGALFNVKFRSPYYKWWGTHNEHSVYPAVKWSHSGKSLWVLFPDGNCKPVPTDILLKRCTNCDEWIRLPSGYYFPGHFCPSIRLD
jgi:hypothetical protein